MAEQDKGKREVILQAAVKVFVEKGFQQAKIEEIAQEADVGKGTVYEYFASKKELFAEMIKYTVEHYMRLIKDQLKTTTDSKGQLKLMVLGHINYCNQYGQMYQVFFRDHSWIGQDFTKWMVQIWQEKVDGFQVILQGGIDKGEFGKMDTRLIATAFLGMLDGICTPIIFANTDVNAEETADKVVGLVLNGIINRNR